MTMWVSIESLLIKSNLVSFILPLIKVGIIFCYNMLSVYDVV